MYIVKEIIEPDFGCEGLPEGQEPLCEVILMSETGKVLKITVPDKELYEKEIIENSKIDYTNGLMNKINT